MSTDDYGLPCNKRSTDGIACQLDRHHPSYHAAKRATRTGWVEWRDGERAFPYNGKHRAAAVSS